MNRENLFRCVREFSRSAHAEKFVVAAAKAHPSDLAEALELLEPEKTLALLSTLDARVAAGLFAYFSRGRRKELLAALSGEPGLLPERRRAVLDAPFPKGSPIRRFVRGRYGDGHVSLPQGHSSGQLRSLAGCSCLVDIPADSGPLAAGETVEVLML